MTKISRNILLMCSAVTIKTQIHQIWSVIDSLKVNMVLYVDSFTSTRLLFVASEQYLSLHPSLKYSDGQAVFTLRKT